MIPHTQEMLIAVLLSGFVWVGVRLLTQPRGFPLVPLLLLLSVFALLADGNALSLPVAEHWLDQEVEAGVGKGVYNAVTVMGLCALALVARVRLDRVVVAREMIAALAVGTAMLVLSTATPVTWQLVPLSELGRDMPMPAIVFYLLGNCYYVYTFIVAAHGVPVIRSKRLVTPQRAGAACLRVGFLTVAVTCAVRSGWIFCPSVRSLDHGVLNRCNFTAANIGTMMICGGLVAPAAAQIFGSGRLRVRRIQQVRQLTPLWVCLMSAFPELRLRQAPHLLFGGLGRVDWAVYRRYIECRDGLTLLSPYLADEIEARQHGDSRLAPGQIADFLVPALARYLKDTPMEGARAAKHVRLGASDDYESDLNGVVQLSRSFGAMRGNIA